MYGEGTRPAFFLIIVKKKEKIRRMRPVLRPAALKINNIRKVLYYVGSSTEKNSDLYRPMGPQQAGRKGVSSHPAAGGTFFRCQSAVHQPGKGVRCSQISRGRDAMPCIRKEIGRCGKKRSETGYDTGKDSKYDMCGRKKSDVHRAGDVPAERNLTGTGRVVGKE